MAIWRSSNKNVYLFQKSNLQKNTEKKYVNLYHTKMIWLSFHDFMPNNSREIEFSSKNHFVHI